MADISKLDELRVKTNKQLLQIINNGLELGIRHARQALKSADTWDAAEYGYSRAKKAYGEGSKLITLIDEITGEEWSKVKARLGHLRGMLEALSGIGSMPSPTEDKIAALARALWEAKGCPEGLPEEDWFRAERALKGPNRCRLVQMN
jgi:hypothetical protein